jgi:hypothetical protein
VRIRTQHFIALGLTMIPERRGCKLFWSFF